LVSLTLAGQWRKGLRQKENHSRKNFYCGAKVKRIIGISNKHQKKINENYMSGKYCR
jgi:hypothetical protein